MTMVRAMYCAKTMSAAQLAAIIPAARNGEAVPVEEAAQLRRLHRRHHHLHQWSVKTVAITPSTDGAMTLAQALR